MTSSTLLAGRFALGDLLGAGGMGEVYAAWDRRDARPVAVKRLRPEFAADPASVARFAREGAILRAAAHPNIVGVLAVAADPAGPCIVMEYVGGGTLEDLLARKPRLPVERALGIALDLSDALARAHRLGVIHRDIKPANVLLAEDGTPRLSDFGIASMGAPDPHPGPGGVVGTLPYLAPEGWDGEAPDERSDIWAFGVLLYEMLAGRRPFAAEHVGMLLAAIAVDEVRPLTALRADVPAPFAAVIGAMLVKDPARRLSSVREVGVIAERLLRGAAPARTTRSNLPRPSDLLIGRADALEDLHRLLTGGEARLVTLTGPGGTGKTRLALAAAEAATAHFPDGVVYVDLTPIGEAALVLPALARALDVEEDLQQPLADVLAARLATARMLIVLDNFEQVLAAGADVAGILGRAPHVTMMVTSRFLLRVGGEREYPVSPLRLPDAGDLASTERLARTEAVALFVARARALDPRFALDAATAPAVAGICRRLDGLPLAIELAAARSRVLPPPALLAHLDRPLSLLTSGGRDRAPHQRTLRETVEWSVRLLDEAERMLFGRLSVFVGGWSLDDALAVVGTGSDLPELVDRLQSLLEKSLVFSVEAGGEPCYGMLVTLREYAAELLDGDPEREAVRRRHARHFAALAVTWSEELGAGGQAEAMIRFSRAHQNLRAAFAWLAEHAPADLPGLAAALSRFWYLGGHWLEALESGGRALALAPGAAAPSRASLLDERARLEMFLGDERAALAHHEEAHVLAAQVGDARLRARTGEGLGEVLLKVGDVGRAAQVLAAAEPVARDSGHPGILAEVLTTMATADVGAGALERAEARLTEALDAGRRSGDRFVLTKIHYYLAGLALLRDVGDRGRTLCEEGRRIARDSGDSAWACHLDEMLGRALIAAGRLDDARELVGHSLTAFHALGSRSCLPHSFEAAARFHLAAAGDGNAPARAAWLLGAADRVCSDLAIAMLPVERALLLDTVRRARNALGEAAYVEAWRAGRAADEASAVARARADLGGDGDSVV